MGTCLLSANGNEGGDLGQLAGKAELLRSLHLELGTYPVAFIHRAAEKRISRHSKSSILHAAGPMGPAAVQERVTSRPDGGVSRGWEHDYAP